MSSSARTDEHAGAPEGLASTLPAAIRSRTRQRPVLYPAGMVVAMAIFVLTQWQISPWSIGRPLLVGLAVGLLLPWLLGLIMGDRDRSGVLAALVVLFLLLGEDLRLVGMLALVAGIVVLATVAGRRVRIRWHLITRVMNAATAIALLAFGLAAVQSGAILRAPRDLIVESPVGRLIAGARASDESLPSVYLVLLDGYPRADKLADVFDIDNESFLRELGSRGFDVASLSRSNYPSTDQTLASILGAWEPALGAETAILRSFMNEGTLIGAFRELGYEVLATSPGIEVAIVREADRFIDTGQVNESEWNLLARGGLGRILWATAPMWLADQHRDRLMATLDEAEAVALESTEHPRLALLHIMSPHSPLVVGAAGDPIPTKRWTDTDDSNEYSILGHDEYARRLAGQIAWTNTRTLGLVDTITAAHPDATVVVFSDHGSGIHETEDDSDPDLRTANLLAVRNPGRMAIVDDRSTLVNVLPRILRSITGDGPDDNPETIWLPETNDAFVEYERPD